MNRLASNSTTATISAATQSSESSMGFFESIGLPPVYAISLQINDFLTERVERTRSLKSLSPNKVAVFFNIGDAMISWSCKELNETTQNKKERELKNFYLNALDRLHEDLCNAKLTKDTVLTVHILFLQRQESGTALFAQTATCSSHNYSHVTTSTAQNLPAPHLFAFIKAHYTTSVEVDEENAVLSFLFPRQ